MTVDDSIIEFVQAAVDLANSVGYDVRTDRQISDRTLLRLKEFMDTHDLFSRTLDPNSKDTTQ